MRAGFAALVCCWLVVFVVPAASGQTRGAGRVVDARTGQAISGARITVVGMTGSARSDADGRFDLDVPAPPFVLAVILPDGTVARPIAVDGQAALDLRVEPAVHEAVTVTGIAPSVDRSPAMAATLLSAAELAWRAPATLADALEAVPGAYFVSQGQAAVPSLRGLARGRTLLLVDGARAGTERRAGPNAAFVDPQAVAGIEVARGFGSVAYGSDAFGGVVALRTRRPDHARPLAGRITAGAGAGVPGWRSEIDLSSGYGSGAVSVSARARDFDDYRSPEGTVPASGWRDQALRLAWSHDAAHGAWFVTWQRSAGRDLGRPRSDTNSVRVTGLREDASRLTASYDAVSVGPFDRVTVHGLFGSARDVTEQDRSAMGMRTRTVERNDTAYRDTEIRASGALTAAGTSLEVGVDAQTRFGLEVADELDAYDRSGTRLATTRTTAIESASSSSLGLFAQARRALATRVSVGAGVRGERVSSRNRAGALGDRASTLWAMAGFGSIDVRLAPRLVATAQVGRGFRSPTLLDRFARGPVGRGFFEGNPDLDAETSLQVDLGLAHVTRRTRVAGFWYRYRIADLIERFAVDADRFTFRNRPAAVLSGVEVEAQVDAGRGWLLESAASWMRGRDATDATPVDDVAPPMASVTARYAAHPAWSAVVRWTSTGRHDQSGPAEVPTPAFTRLDAGGSWRAGRGLSLHVAARNLTDAPYYASAGPRWVYAPGRQVMLTLVATY